MKKLDTAIVNLHPEDNGGETVTISVDIFDNGDHAEGIFTIGTVSLQSYAHSASIIIGSVTSQSLRELADDLDAKIAIAKASFDS